MEFTQVPPTNLLGGQSAPVPPSIPAPEPETQEVEKAAAAAPAPVKTSEDQAKEVRLAQMVKAKKAQIMRERAIKQERMALTKEKQEIEAFRQAQAQAKLDPDGYLKAGGLTYEELVNYYLNGKKVSPESQVESVKQELERFKQEQEQKEQVMMQRQAQAAAAQATEVINTFKERIGDFVHANPDKYELVNREGEEAQELMFELVEENFKRTKKVITIEQAADLMEQYLEEKLQGYKDTKKWSKLFPQAQAASNKEEPALRASERRTLSNIDTAASAAATTLPAAT